MNPSLLQRHLDSRNKTELLANAATYYGAKTLFITLWIRLRLPFCRPGFESQAHVRITFSNLNLN